MKITPKEFANKYLHPYRIRGEEIIPERCPYCKGGEHGRDKHSSAVNIDDGVFNCKRGTCDTRKTFYQMLVDFKEVEPYDAHYNRQESFRSRRKKREYKPPKVKVEKTMDKKAGDYLKKRGISEATWKKRKVFSKDGAIAFPYYKDGELVLVKYREPKKKGKWWREKGGKAVFWGLENCDPEYPLVITEGEFDALALDEAGVKNAVSVPSGAEDLNCIDEDWVLLEKFSKIIIWPDNDEPGKKMLKKLITRLGEYRCYVVNSPFKDANEHLYKHDAKDVQLVVEIAEEVPIQGLIRLAEVESFDPHSAEKVRAGIPQLDQQIGGFFLGNISVWTGENGSGKSTLLGQLLLNAIQQGKAITAYSGELPAGLFRYWTELQMAGEENLIEKVDDFTGKTGYYVPQEIKDKMKAWYYDRFFLHDSFGGSKQEDILKIFEYAARRFNCKLFLVDNIMTTELGGSERDYYRLQSEFIGACKDFSHKFDCHVHIVAHPRKTIGEITKQDVAGSGDITNRADNVFLVKRLKPEEKEERRGEGKPDADTLVLGMKNRLYGVQDFQIPLQFNIKSKRFWYPGKGENFKYGWEV